MRNCARRRNSFGIRYPMAIPLRSSTAHSHYSSRISRRRRSGTAASALESPPQRARRRDNRRIARARTNALMSRSRLSHANPKHASSAGVDPPKGRAESAALVTFRWRCGGRCGHAMADDAHSRPRMDAAAMNAVFSSSITTSPMATMAPRPSKTFSCVAVRTISMRPTCTLVLAPARSAAGRRRIDNVTVRVAERLSFADTMPERARRDLSLVVVAAILAVCAAE